ncbi:MAG TPA: NosD domain-containing protein [Acidimicrobiia bacterium]|nr:NosD domain-containing protein [Acidimicrobiia bacterium]
MITAAVATALIAFAIVLPIWRSSLSAPQYPQGLEFVAYGDRVEGDLEEIDSLNHYVGMRPFRTDDLPEMALWPVGIVGAFAAIAVAGFLSARWPLIARLARLYLWLLPVTVLGAIQVRLYQFGHDLDPGAAFRMDGFTPLVIGPTTVWNFTAWSMPGTGIYAMLAAAAVLSFGPRLLARIRPAAAATALIPVLLVGTLTPLAAAETRLDLAALLAAAPDGATITLEPGTYTGNVVIDRPVTIDGAGNASIVGDRTGTVVTIAAPGTTIRGVRVSGSGPGPSGSPAGIRIDADDAVVEGVVVTDSYIGISVASAARVRIVDSHVIGRGGTVSGDDHAVGGDDLAGGGRGDGISLWHVDGVLVRNTTVEGVRDAIFVSFGSGTLIDGNRLMDSRYGVHSMFAGSLTLAENVVRGNLSGAVLMYGGPALILRNQLTDSSSASTGFGLLVKDVADVEAVENVVVRNRVGIHVDGPASGDSPIRFTANTIADNQVGVAFYPSAEAVFMANSFVDNVVQVLQQGRGTADGVRWNDRGHGNHWSTYRGYDNGLGRGTTPHAEGSTIERVLVRAPVLMPLASSPAFRLIRAIEERWSLQRPVLVDPLPLTRSAAPPVPIQAAQPIAGVALAAIGLAATLVSVRALRGGFPTHRPGVAG